MPENNSINLDLLDNIIYGRVEPHLYAFSTETIPNYLKIGDTYRPIEKRLNEWRKFFPNLERRFSAEAKVDSENYYRDLSVHYFLEHERQKQRLQIDAIPDIPYYSKEFFRNTSIDDINDAIKDIQGNFDENSGKYQFYKFEGNRIPAAFTYIRNLDFEPRPNQQVAIDNFRYAIEQGRTNLLLYAVMRFGKSFTSMCCALEMEAKTVVVVSAKADVKEEWKKTVESHIKFSEFDFLDSDNLLESDTIISEKLAENKKVVVFLTLQDLQGGTIKAKHQEIFGSQIDLLIIDETHFGARAEEYGKVLNVSNAELKRELKHGDANLEELDSSIKFLDSKIRLHLSGTPYRILMGSEFSDEDIIAFYQFTDIANDQEKWDEENLNKDDVKEWDNPYFGFPQMVRFAFNPNASSRQRMEDLKKHGVTYAFSALFKPKSIKKDTVNNLHQEFQYEEEILQLLEVIDGSDSDENLLSFLDYDRIKEGKMCRHIVCVLPYRASCDAMETLIQNNKTEFKNLNQYEIINIAGVHNENIYRSTQDVKNKIKQLESENKKTLTLTVNRMLTGTTVEEWDTMLYLKDTASPQEYDQAIFRLQNQYVKELTDDNGDVIKFNMKPQTLLVDFNPNRVFVMQEQKAQIYNINTDSNGNSKLEERLRRELEVSPIVVVNSSRMVQIASADILDAVRKYSSEKSVLDEATVIPVDYTLLQNEAIRLEIEKQGELGSKQGFKINATDEEEGDEFDIPNTQESGNTNSGQNGTGTETETETESIIPPEKDNENSFKKKFATYYSKILFFAFLTTSEVKSLQDILDSLADGDNIRIFRNLGLSRPIARQLNISLNPYILSDLDYKIQNINSLTNDEQLSPIDRASIALKKFSRLSDSEVVTPEAVADSVVNLLPVEAINNETRMLDLASKQGEFVYSVFKKFGKTIAENFYSIPTSAVAYEFTRKVYQLLGLDISCIEMHYSSYDLLDESKNLIENDNITFNNEEMKFDVVIGNPPYQEKDGGAGASAKPIYNQFVKIAKNLQPNFISMIIPTRWFAGGKGLDDFRDEMLNDVHISELHDYLNPKVLFKDTNNRGGICYFLWNNNYNNEENNVKISTYRDRVPSVSYRRLKNNDSDIYIRHIESLSILEKIKNNENFQSIEGYVSSRKPFNLDGNVIKNNRIFKKRRSNENDLLCFGKGKTIGYVAEDLISRNINWINRNKVFAPYANNIGTELNDDNLNTFVGKSGEICTETYIVIGGDLNLDMLAATNLSTYFTSKLPRFLQSLAKSSQHGTSKTYKFIPLQDFSQDSDIDWSSSVAEIDQQLYAKYNLSEEEIDFIEESIKPMDT